jgi:TPR repeat protein
MYTEGIGVEASEQKAQRYFRMASQQHLLEECEFGAQTGQYADQFYLGWMYEHGVYVEKDIEKAKELYKQAADQGFELAIDRLSEL